MKPVLKIFFLIFLFLSSEAFATENSFNGNYVVKNYTWCNGPADSETVDCWPYGWQRVNLGKLVQIQIDSIQNVNYITLTDSAGFSWSANFHPHYSQDGHTFITQLGDTNNRLDITINDKELSMMVYWGGQISYLVMTHLKN